MAKSVLPLARKILAKDGGTVLRPVEVNDKVVGEFELAYVRSAHSKHTNTEAASGPPIVVIPGGPGMASVYPYSSFRRNATASDLDVIMVEHRGVGLSRTMTNGSDLSMTTVTVENAAADIKAVLDALGVPEAIICGSSYGTYLAQAFATTFPQRVKALVLDSPMFSIKQDIVDNTAYRRETLLSDGIPTADAIRTLVQRGENLKDLSHVCQVVYEFAGADSLARLLRSREGGKASWLWSMLAKLGLEEVDGAGMRGYIEPDLVAGISFGQLGFGLPGDGEVLDSQLFLAATKGAPTFVGEPYNFPELLPRLKRPVVIASGERDLRTSRKVAERIEAATKDSTLVAIPDTGHSLLDTHQRALIEILQAVRSGRPHSLLDDGTRLSALKRDGGSAWLARFLRLAIRMLS